MTGKPVRVLSSAFRRQTPDMTITVLTAHRWRLEEKACVIYSLNREW
jgi:hypothetical protein